MNAKPTVTYLPSTNFIDENESTRRIKLPFFTEGDFESIAKKSNNQFVGQYDPDTKTVQPYSTPPSNLDFSKYGVGVYAFFDFTLSQIFVFGVLSICAGAAIYFNVIGSQS